ncbi:TetR family transcriptional regulator [Nonomuraea longicatena]|uniref:TetR/AcrR family transcriptional regulator n=1 Tax=Nonomuraea longicatena TaxID=83682 RepID=A0ABP3ZQQ6_9ACTN
MSPESGTRSRTRRAILAAAAAVLARDRAATLADIADAADVARSTLHRYFTDRDELVRAAIVDSLSMVEEQQKAAAIDQGPADEAMRRLLVAMVDAGERLAFLFADPDLAKTLDQAKWDPDPAVPGTLDLIRRGQAEGVFDPGQKPEWVQRVIWALTYSGWEAGEKGELARHEIAGAVIRTFEAGTLTRP